ncbi:MAG TPA: DUF6132 family protein [Sunxiuqinia sp.]|nr:DUF6132 family protein [Sunxiuqinia sp.]
MMKQFVLKYKWRIVGIVVGSIAGFLYWRFVGCTSGTCPIQSHWQSSTLFGGLFGYLLTDFKKKTKKTAEDGKV